MEVVKKSASMNRTSNVLLQSQLVLQDIQVKQASLESRLSALDAQKIVDLGLYDNQNEEEGEIMLLAMILLQLHGVKIPMNQTTEDDGFNKKKRQRTSPDQLAILEEIFQTDKMPNQQTRVHLADKLGMSSRRVQIWFQNKRAKVKRHGPGKDTDYPESLFSRRGSVSSDMSDDLESPLDESGCSSLSSSSSEITPAKGSSSFWSASSNPSSSSIPMSLSTAVSAAVAQIPFSFSPPSKQFSLSSFEPKSNLLPDFMSPRLSFAQSI